MIPTRLRVCIPGPRTRVPPGNIANKLPTTVLRYPSTLVPRDPAGVVPCDPGTGSRELSRFSDGPGEPATECAYPPAGTVTR
eukprot:828168-Rhodomonas_salina.1